MWEKYVSPSHHESVFPHRWPTNSLGKDLWFLTSCISAQGVSLSRTVPRFLPRKKVRKWSASFFQKHWLFGQVTSTLWAFNSLSLKSWLELDYSLESILVLTFRHWNNSLSRVYGFSNTFQVVTEFPWVPGNISFTHVDILKIDMSIFKIQIVNIWSIMWNQKK